MTTKVPSMDHRWGTRIDLDVPGLLWTEDGTSTEVVVHNASLSGAYVRTVARLPQLTRVMLRTWGGEGWALPACVVRHDRGGMGLEWLDPGPHVLRAMIDAEPDRQQEFSGEILRA